MAGKIKKVALALLFNFSSTLRTLFFIPHGSCRYQPTCSNYAKEALIKLPVYIAIPRIIYRVLRCNPFSNGGYDPVIKTGDRVE